MCPPKKKLDGLTLLRGRLRLEQSSVLHRALSFQPNKIIYKTEFERCVKLIENKIEHTFVKINER